MFYLPLVHNIALVIALGVLHALLERSMKWQRAPRQVVEGLLFGAFILVAMKTPLRWSPGIIFDGRSILLTLAGLFGGPLSALVAAIPALAYRIWLGGAGAPMGVAVILTAATLGSVGYRLRARHPWVTSPWGLLGLGVTVHLVMASLLTTLPGGLSLHVFLTLALPVLLLYPLAFLAAALWFMEAETRRRMAEALHLKDAALDSSITAIALTDTRGLLSYVNPAALRLWGITDAQHAVGKPSSIFWEDASLSPGILQEALQHGSATGERMAVRSDGSTFPVQYQVSLARDTGGAIVGYMGSFLDLTERKRDEAERRTLTAQLHQSQKLESLGSLAGGVAHDLNNVLAAILTTASAQREELPEDDPVGRSLDLIAQACMRGGTVVKNLLAFARKQVGQLEPVDLRLLLHDLAALLASTTLKKVDLVTDLEDPLPAIHGDAASLGHALMNLCVNALDAMPEGGTLTLRGRATPAGCVTLQVADTGHGMPAEVLEKALDPFFTTKPLGKGTGLGLSMVYGTVQAHGGTFQLQSTPEQGTVATLILPLGTTDQAPAPPAGAALEPALPTPHKALRILVIDDDDLVRESLVAYLRHRHHQVTGATRAQEGLDRLSEGLAVDLVILDMNMPGMTGAEALPRILALRPGLPVFISSGYTHADLDPLLSDHPSATLLPKPFSLAELGARLDAIQGR